MEEKKVVIKVVVDTDILIDFFRTNSGLFPTLLIFQSQGEIELYISSVTVFELFSGSSSKEEETNIIEIASRIKIIPFDFTLAKFAGELKRDARLKTALADLFIGTTALYLNARLATRNKTHFAALPQIEFLATPKAG